MNHPFEKLMKMELIALIVVLIVGTIAIAKGLFLLMIIGLYGIAASMIFSGMAAMSTRHPVTGIKQFLRAIILIILATLIISIWYNTAT
ncbi:hypothetical protein JNUCC1_01247 [Lentibacillus sp. JNUCC-1]|uniref:hypothetical protein n=1 Tax=Lentibacillus sp. JNUCC-1 TaxID=2654513 RepID=UPI0012E92CF1|nr:hypothetical protein [Lentibacillus sp. JNUCC-1]MUV37441.1 hypothetical protein [Lentibacillus sp. JNUCC-1]